MAQLVKKTPFEKGYSDQLRTEIDFGDFDEKEFSETPYEFEKRFKESSPANKFKYKTPIEQAEAMQPKYNKDAAVAYLKNYGSGFDDENYENWARKKGKQLVKEPLPKEFIGTDFHKQWYGADRDYTYANQYLNDDEWLQLVWQDIAEDATEYYNDLQRQKANIGDEHDADYERSWGPKDDEE